MNIQEAKNALDRIINKARIHFYKPIQIAEILYRDRVEEDIILSDLSTYKNPSRKWRDIICMEFLGRASTSSSRYQDDVFNENAIPPDVLIELGKENRLRGGVVEAYIYNKFEQRFTQMSSGLSYCMTHDRNDFELEDFLNLFWNEPGLRRSIDKIYEIVVYSLFSALVDALDISVEVSMNPLKIDILHEFDDFAKKVIQLTPSRTTMTLKAQINRAGVTNASDRGLDMWANFGLAIQIKHLSLTEELAESIVSSVSTDRIVIVCKDSEERIILSILNQIGWKSKIQSVVTENDLTNWYEKALRGTYSDLTGENILQKIMNEIKIEFPATDDKEFMRFMKQRGYDNMLDGLWI